MRDRRLIEIEDRLSLRAPIIEAIFYALSKLLNEGSHQAALVEVGWQQINDLEKEIRSALKQEPHQQEEKP